MPIAQGPAPAQDIGPYWRWMGSAVLLLLAAYVLIGRWRGESEDYFTVGVIVALVVLLLAILRPPFLDAWMKDFATWLPWTQYDKSAAPPGSAP
ncbi:MAG: hypothetical protein SGJ01_04655 [Gemmatimonadota bacterium]|nr:hypothetical protein [Gemmatimonadota bacterium]